MHSHDNPIYLEYTNTFAAHLCLPEDRSGTRGYCPVSRAFFAGLALHFIGFNTVAKQFYCYHYMHASE